MNNTYSNSQASGFGRNTYESEAFRLQKEADNFTKNFEHQKKRLVLLEDQFKQAQDELAEKKARLTQIRPSSA